MIIYGALLIPFALAFVLYRFFAHHTVWWEFAVPFVATLLFVVIMKLIIEKVQTTSNEYWGSMVQRAEYYEDWDEEVPCRHSYDCNCRTDSKGNRSCNTCYMHLYDVDYHPPYWKLVTTTNEEVSISEHEYNRLKRLFGNEKFRDLHRSYHSKDGDEYHSTWPHDSASAVPVTTTHTYENRVKASDQSVFHFEPVSDSNVRRFAIKAYPQMTGYTMQAVIGDSSRDAFMADKKIQYINALLGPRKQVRVFVLVFKNQPIRAAFVQEWHWCGGNKNEFIVCIGIDGQRNVQWCKPISWTRNEELKARVKAFVQDQKQLNLMALANYMQPQLDKGFERLSFKEFDYLTVEPPTWAVILTYLLALGINIGIGYWVVGNDIMDS